MSSTQNMTFGFIPKDWDTELERISVGDPAGSQTTEVNFKFSGAHFEFPNANILVTDGLWDPESDFWKDIAKVLLTFFPGVNTKLSPSALGRAYQIFSEEDNDYTGLILVAGPEDGGEFRNDDGKFNGKFYFKYDYEDEDEYFEERILILK